MLFSLELASGTEITLGASGLILVPSSNINRSIRLSLSPDGRSILYGSGEFTGNLWILQGLRRRAASGRGLDWPADLAQPRSAASLVEAEGQRKKRPRV